MGWQMVFLRQIADLCRRTQTDYLRLQNDDDLAKLLTLPLLKRLMEVER